nr:high chlorophyll fluorescence phenotype 173 [Tanacetum cinerariifolium]
MGAKFARGLISRMKLPLNMMDEWTRNLNSARVEMQFFRLCYFAIGYVYTRGYVDLSTKLSLPLSSTLDRYEGLILLIGGNRRSYVLILESGPTTDASHNIQYISRISTKVRFCRVRVPLSSFRPVNPADPPLDPFLIHTFTIRFEPRRQ